MAALTSTLPNALLKRITEKASTLSISENKLIENALLFYLEHLEKAEYAKSYQQEAKDEDILLLAEEGLQEYLKQLEA
jgi:hypothetical protein